MLRSSTIFPGMMLLAWLASTAPAAEKITPEQEKFFEDQVRPILAEKCWSCHGEKKQESELRLDSATAMNRGGASGDKIFTSEKPDESLLLRAVRHEGELKMPPKEKLSPEQIAALTTWVQQGALWPEKGNSVPVSLSAAERAPVHRQSHWAFQPIRNPAVPAVKDSSWPRHELDRYVLAQQEAKGIAPSPTVDRRTLIRRVTFDLIGLPPTFEEVEAFANDDSPTAYEQLVTRLLDSPHYGERWGRHWLDVARYADTRGYNFEGDRRYPYSYTYRDYVINAFNRDLPLNRFIVEQIAADQLELGDDRSALAALGFITVGRKYLSIQDTYDDQINVVSRGLLGLSVGCARCHDHKYDAIPSEDYYSLYGVFASASEPANDKLPIIGDPAKIAGFEEFQKKLDQLTGDYNNFLEGKRNEIGNFARDHIVDYLALVATNTSNDAIEKAAFLTVKPDEIRKRIVDRMRDYLRGRAKPENATFGYWAEIIALPEDGFAEKAKEVSERWKQRPVGLAAGQVNPALKTALETIALQQKQEIAKVYSDLIRKAYEVYQTLGGNEEAIGKISEELQPFAHLLADKDSPVVFTNDSIMGLFNREEANKNRDLKKKIDEFQASSPNAPPRAMVLQENATPHNPHVFIRGNHSRPGKQVPRQFLYVLAENRQPFPTRGGRLDLAQAIVATENPLTRRVLVNRIWMHHFGEPLVDTPSDFGIRTPQPTQAALLDHLANYLLEHGWSLKALHRYIVSSATYRQASQERAQDGAVARAIDPENRLLWKMNRRRLEWEALRDSLLAVSGQLDRTAGGKPVEIAKPPYSKRRSVYAYLDRQDLPNLFRTFDLASPDSSAANRPRTTVPQQSLYLMNSPFVIEQSSALAQRSSSPDNSTSEKRIEQLYRLAFARTPSAEERQLAEKFIAEASANPGDNQLGAWEQLAQLLMLTNEFSYVD